MVLFLFCRRGFETDVIGTLKRAYRALFLAHVPRHAALARVRERWGDVPAVARLCDFIAASQRGVCR